LKVYKGTVQEDISIFEWWREIAGTTDGDLYKMLPRSSWPLSCFYQLFRPPKTLLYAEDDKGIWFAVWLERMESAGIFSMWVAKRWRGTLKQYRITKLAYEGSFEMFPVLLGMTKQPDLLDEHKKVGYEVLGKVPGLFGGQEDAWIVMLTREAFERGALGKEL
jgi:hypothetical protein